MSSSPSTPPQSPVPTDPPAAPAPDQKSIPLSQRLRNLNPLVKVSFFAFLILVAIAWFVYSGQVTTDDAQVDCHITAVAPQVPGYVVKLFFNDNTPVKAGDILLQIDPRPYEAEVDQAKASLAVAEAQANSAKLQIGLTRETTMNSTGSATAPVSYTHLTLPTILLV